MEFRWLTSEEQRARRVESGSLSEVLSLAQTLQAEADGLLTEEQVIETSRELGIRPEHVREALCLRRDAAVSAASLADEPDRTWIDDRLLASVAQAFLLIVAVGFLPLTLFGLNAPLLPLVFSFSLLAALIVGAVARQPRLAGLAGAVAVPLVLGVAIVYAEKIQPYLDLSFGAFLLSILSFSPLCAVAGRAGAKLRCWAERLLERMGGMALEH